MSRSEPSKTRTNLHTWTLALLLSLVILPVCAYIGGRLVVGEYEGPSGLLGYLSAILADAGRGSWLALILILAPAGVFGLWALILRSRNKK